MPARLLAIEIVRRLQANGFQAYWVGGCVRDLLLRREPQDYDIATSATPAQIEQLFSRTVPVGKQFGVMLVVEGDYQFEVATFRADAAYEDGRHPSQVTFSDAKADALRRDFTVNGLFYDPIQGRVFDWVGGEADLRAQVLRTIGVPEERFAEDHLRLLRTVRFAAQLGFQTAAETWTALQNNAPRIRRVSAERIRDELIKLFRPPYAARGLNLLRESGLMIQVLPELEATAGCEQSPDFHPEGTVFNHLRRMLDQMPSGAPDSLPWAILLHDIGKPVTFAEDAETGAIHFYGHEKVGAEMAGEILRRLKFPRRQIDDVVHAVRCHMQFKDAPQMRKATLRRMILRPTFPLELELHRLDCLGSHGNLDVYDLLVSEASALQQQPAIKPPLLTGHDLAALGIEPGPAMGELLRHIRDMQLQDELTTPEAARAWVLEERKKQPSS